MSLKKNIVTTVAVRILRLFTGFVCTMLLARFLKPEGMGIVATFMAVPLMLSSLAELGVRQSIAYSVGQEKYDLNDISRTTSFLWLFTSILSIITVLVVYYLQGMYSYGLELCMIGALYVPVTLIMRYANGIGLGKQWISRINIGAACNAFGRLALILLFVVLLKLSVTGALLMEVIVVLLPGALMLYWLKTDINLSFIPRWNFQLSKLLLIHGVKYALALFVISLNYRINILILQRFVNNADIGCFSVGIRLAELIWLIPASVGMVIFSHSTAAKDAKEFSLKTAQAMRFNLLLCGVGAIALAIICPLFVRIVFGEKYLPAVPVIRWMLPGIVMMVVFKVLNADLAGKGKPLVALKCFTYALIINIVFNYILIPKYGINGSAIASTISYVIGAIVFLKLYSVETAIRPIKIIFNFNEDIVTLRSIARNIYRSNSWLKKEKF